MEYDVYDFEITNADKKYWNQNKWDLSDYDLMKLKLKLAMFPSFRNCSESHGKDITKPVISHIKVKIKFKDNNMIIIIIGETGTGKSRIAQAIARIILGRLKRDFIKNITFSNENFLQRCADVKRGGVVIKDEETKQYGIGSEREAQEMENIEMVVRKFGLNLIFCSPYAKYEHSTKHLELETICISRKYRKCKVAVKHGKIYLGYMIFTIPKDENDVVWQEYDKRDAGDKDKFIQLIKERKIMRVDYKALSKEIQKHPKWEKGMGYYDVQFIAREQNPNLTEAEVRNIARGYYLYHERRKVKKYGE